MKIKGISFEQAEALLDKKSPSKKDEETDEELEQEEIITT